MRNHRRLAIAMTLAAIWAGSAIPALASDNGTVDASVTVATPCIIVAPPALDFGTLPFTTSTAQGYAFRQIQLSNCGTSAEQLFGRATDASIGGQPAWSLVSDQEPCFEGVNKYNLRSWGAEPAPLTHLSTSDQAVETVAAGSDALTNELRLIMPCVGSDGIGEVVTFQAIFTATF